MEVEFDSVISSSSICMCMTANWFGLGLVSGSLNSIAANEPQGRRITLCIHAFFFLFFFFLSLVKFESWKCTCTELNFEMFNPFMCFFLYESPVKTPSFYIRLFDPLKYALSPSPLTSGAEISSTVGSTPSRMTCPAKSAKELRNNGCMWSAVHSITDLNLSGHG